MEPCFTYDMGGQQDTPGGRGCCEARDARWEEIGLFSFYACDNHRKMLFLRTALVLFLIIKVTYSLGRTWKQKITSKVKNVWFSIADDCPLL